MPKTLELPEQVTFIPEECTHCDGDGDIEDGGFIFPCPICGGTGRV